MANGVSCAFFAGKNLIYGQKEKNIFKEGIGGIQATRTVDSIAQSGAVKIPGSSGISRVAKVAKKVLYPLIIASGIFNTIKSDDKVKTGITQASSIASMYTFETVSEKALIAAEKRLISLPAIQKNKYLRFGVYALKGLCFVGASILGYNTGNAISGKAVDIARTIKNDKNTSDYDYIETDLQDDGNIFENMELIKEE